MYFITQDYLVTTLNTLEIGRICGFVDHFVLGQ